MFDPFDNAPLAAPKELRPHQTKALQMLRQSLAKEKRVVVQMPTGAGKTLILSKVTGEIVQKKQKALIKL